MFGWPKVPQGAPTVPLPPYPQRPPGHPLGGVPPIPQLHFGATHGAYPTPVPMIPGMGGMGPTTLPPPIPRPPTLSGYLSQTPPPQMPQPQVPQHEAPQAAQNVPPPQESPTSCAKDRTEGASNGERPKRSFEETVNEAQRRAEEARRNMEEEQRRPQREGSGGDAGQRPPPTEEDLRELQTWLKRFPTLDSKAHSALESLDPRDAVKALQELDQKPGVRNPSEMVLGKAWVCKTAQSVRERMGGKAPPEEKSEKKDLDIVDHYGALEVNEDADEKDIKKAYRKLVLKWHPDKHPEGREEAEEKIRAINNAYETVSNATKRATYDAQRQALMRQRSGHGPTDIQGAPRQRIPREFMLQPIGFPDKFVRYASERAMSQCEVTSRADARLDGKSGLDQFVPFFRAAKLSLWWLPDVNNMCRIRALEARTRSSAGEKVVAGRPGGFNLGFEIEVGRDSDLKLMEAGKGERNENVNFIVVSSPLYDNAFRFEAAFRKGYYLAFRAPTQLRMIPYNGGPLPKKVVIDFTLVDFQAMFKFIDIEEVLRPVIESKGGWVPLVDVKTDANVTAYFGNILQKPMWDDDDFQTYFEGHFEMWEFRSQPQLSVRLRGVDERLGHALGRVKDADEAASLVVMAGEELKRLHWRYLLHAFEALQKPGSEEISAVVERMEAQRRMLGAIGGMLNIQVEFSQLVRLAKLLQMPGNSKDVAQRMDAEASALSKVVLARAKAVEAGQLADVVKVDDLKFILSLPGMSNADGVDDTDVLARIMSPPLSEASLDKISETISTASAASAQAFAKEAGQVALHKVSRFGSSGKDVTTVVVALANSGLLLESCASLVAQHAPVLKAEDLAMALAAIGDKGYEGPEVAAACNALGDARSFAQLPSQRLLGLAVSATKSLAMSSAVSGRVLEAAVEVLGTWPPQEAIRLLLALAKPKTQPTGEANSSETNPLWAKLLQRAAAVVRPTLPELPAAELIRLALAAKSHAAQGQDLLEVVAAEALKRLSELPQAHLLLMTQGLIALGGAHPSVRSICDFWGEVLSEDATQGDAVSSRREQLEKGQALNGEQVAKLGQMLEPIASDLDTDTFTRCYGGLCKRLQRLSRSLSNATRSSILDQVRRGQGVGLWEPGRSKLKQALEKSRTRSRSRKRRSSSRKRGRRRRSTSSSRSRSR